MYSTLKRRKSISSQAASISAWCAVFDWPSIVAAFSVSRHGPASSSAARRKTAARSSHGQRDQSCHAARGGVDRLRDVLGARLVDVGEHVLLVVRHDGRARVAGGDVLAADHERDLDPLAGHLREPRLERRALGAPGRVVADRLVARRRRRKCACVLSAAPCTRYVAATSTQIMKPSDEAQKVEPTNVQSAAASQTPSRRTAMPPAMPSRPNQRGTLRASSAASDEPMITRRRAGGARRGDLGRARGERGRLQRDQRGAAEHDDAREEPVRVVADDPRVQAAEEPEQRERGGRRRAPRRPARGSCRAPARALRSGT